MVFFGLYILVQISKRVKRLKMGHVAALLRVDVLFAYFVDLARVDFKDCIFWIPLGVIFF
jgi:hypothetical protein